MVGKQMACSGLSDIILEAGLINSGSLKGVITGQQYERVNAYAQCAALSIGAAICLIGFCPTNATMNYLANF